MLIALHKNARTTPAVRAEIAASNDTASVLAQRFGITEQTVYKWKKREVFGDRSHTAHRLQTVLTPAQEVIVVHLRRTLMLPLDDLLAVTREFLSPDVSRSGLDRCLRRHGVGSLGALKPQEPAVTHKAFKSYEPGYVHMDVKYLPRMQDESRRRYLFVAIDRATRWVFVQLKANRTSASAQAFLKGLHKACPIKIHKLLTDNGKEFTDRLFASKAREPSGNHEFDRLCQELGIEHRLTRPRTPRTNGMVERFNGRIADVLKTHRFNSREDMEQTLLRYVTLYNHQLPQSALTSKTPMQAMKEWYGSHPHLFHKRPYDRPGCDSYALRPAQDIDLGQLRLRPPKLTQLALDLQVQAVRRHSTQTDPQTLRVSGAIQVQLRNAGTLAAPADVAVLAFEDGNANGAYDEGSDTVLGQATLQALDAGQSASMAIDVAGLLAFRDAPIHVIVDPLGALVESDKVNNIRSSAQDVLYTPESKTFAPKLKWSWTNGSVMMSPVVGRIHDTNRDGRIDALDTPQIVLGAYRGSYSSPADIYVLDGKTGAETLKIPVSSFGGTSSQTGLVLADLDSDGVPEIIAINFNIGGLTVFRNDGSVKFKTTGGVPIGVSVADIDADGVPEILLGNSVFDNKGQVKLTLAGCDAHDSAYAFRLDPALAGLQIICGGQVYDSLGRLLFPLGINSIYRFAVADFLGDGKPQFALVANGSLYLVDNQGQRLWSTHLGGGNGGTPTAADLDGDGIPEIGVAGSGYYTVVRGDGSILWQARIQDYSSSSTGSTAFDFDGDGKVEIVYRDEVRLFVFDGATGKIVFSSDSGSLTGAEYPLVADVDADGRADIVVPEDAGGFHGIRVFEDLNNSWVPTRSVWNQFDYSITNINDDLSVPRNPEPSWKSHNSFRLNRRMDADPRAIADLSASYVRIDDRGAGPGSRIIVRLGNAGSYKVPADTSVAVYNTDPALGQPPAAALVARGLTQSVLEPGGYEDLALRPALPLDQLSAQGKVWIVADDDGSGTHSLSDFDRSNNLVQADLGAIARNLQIAVASDKAVYTETESATFTATVRNGGSFARDALVRLSVEDAAGHTVDILPLGAAIHIRPGADGQVPAPWSAATVLAGDYRVRAELITAQGLVHGSATAPFAVQAGASPANSTRISSDRSRYSAANTVLLHSRVANLSGNQLQADLQAITEVTAPQGQTVLSRTERIAQASPRSQRQYQYSLPAAKLPPGRYQASLRLLSASGAVLAQSSTGFGIDDSHQTGIGLTGQLLAEPAALAPGNLSRLRLDISNHGNAAIRDATVRVRVLDADSAAVLASFTQPAVQWAIGASTSHAWDWSATGAAGAILPVAATVELGGAEIPIAQTTIRLTASTAPAPQIPPQTPQQPTLTGTLTATPKTVAAGAAVELNYKAHNPNHHSLEASLSLSIRAAGNNSTVLQQWVFAQTLAAGANFLGNQRWLPQAKASGNSYEATWSATIAGETTVLASDSFSMASAAGAPDANVQAQIGSSADPRPLVLLSCSDADDGQPQSPACDETKARALRAYLKGRGFSATVVTSRAEFETAMRCGNHNIYWLSASADKLSDSAVQELREAAERGAGLLLDGAPAARDGILHRALGVAMQGSSGQTHPVASLGGSIYTDGIGLPTVGVPVRYRIEGATVQAILTGGAPAIASRQLGQGRGLVFAFNLASVLAPARPEANDERASVLHSSLRYLSQPVVNTSVPDAPQTLVTELHNRSEQAIAVSLQALLPAGLHFLSASPRPEGSRPMASSPLTHGQPAAHWRWHIELPPGGTRTIFLYVRAAQPGHYDVPLHIETRSAGAGADAPARTQTLTHLVTIRSAQALASQARQTLAALQTGATTDAAAVAQQAASQATDLMAQGQHAQSLAQWLVAANALRSLAPDVNAASTADARQAIAQALQATQRQLCRQWACLSGALDARVNGQPNHQVPLQGHITVSRTVHNHCAAPIGNLPVTAQWTNRRTGARVQSLSDQLSLAGHQKERRDTDWQAQGQDGDYIDLTLTVQWQEQLLHLDRDILHIASPRSLKIRDPQRQ